MILNLKDMDSVHLEITKLSDDSLIYNENLQQESFYSPQIFAGESYKVTLTETVDGNSKSYSKGVTESISFKFFIYSKSRYSSATSFE